MAEKNICDKHDQKTNQPQIMKYFRNGDHIRDIPFIELLRIKDTNDIKEGDFEEIKILRRKLRSRLYSRMSRERKIKELTKLEEIRKQLEEQQRELEHEIEMLREDIKEYTKPM